MLLQHYIRQYYNGNQSELAREIGRSPQVISNWINQSYIVIDRTVYKPTLKLPAPLKLSHQYRKMTPKKTGELFRQYPRGPHYHDN